MGKRRTIGTGLRWVGCLTTVFLALTFIVTGLVVFKFFAGAIRVGNGGIMLVLKDHQSSGPFIDIDGDARAGWSMWLPGGFGDSGGVILVLPLWIPILLVAIPTLIMWLIWARRKANRQVGKCTKCNRYWRGLAADATCPECSVVPSAPNA